MDDSVVRRGEGGALEWRLLGCEGMGSAGAGVVVADFVWSYCCC